MATSNYASNIHNRLPVFHLPITDRYGRHETAGYSPSQYQGIVVHSATSHQASVLVNNSGGGGGVGGVGGGTTVDPRTTTTTTGSGGVGDDWLLGGRCSFDHGGGSRRDPRSPVPSIRSTDDPTPSRPLRHLSMDDDDLIHCTYTYSPSVSGGGALLLHDSPKCSPLLHHEVHHYGMMGGVCGGVGVGGGGVGMGGGGYFSTARHKMSSGHCGSGSPQFDAQRFG